jgi:tetratricopeptide (TPR) repeat protein
MTPAEPDFAASLTDDKMQIRVRFGHKTYCLSLSKAFTFAHELACRKKYHDAARVCEALVQSEHVGARASIMLAFCKARMKDYSSCSELLRKLFGEDNAAVAEALHTAFVYINLGLLSDAIRELATVADGRPDLPSACLLLGDLFAGVGQRKKAIQCWQLAIQRDQPDGSVASEARREVAALLGQGQSPRSNGAAANGNGSGRQK